MLHDTFVVLAFSSESSSDLARLRALCEGCREGVYQKTVIVAVGKEVRNVPEEADFEEGLLWCQKDFSSTESFLEVIKAYQPRKVMLDYFFYVDSYAIRSYGGWFGPEGHIVKAFGQCPKLEEIVLPYAFTENANLAALSEADLRVERRGDSELFVTDKTLGDQNWKHKSTAEVAVENVNGFSVFLRKN